MPPAARKYVFGNMLAGAAIAGFVRAGGDPLAPARRASPSSSAWPAGWRPLCLVGAPADLLPVAALVRRAGADLHRDGQRLRARPAGADPGLAGDAADPARRHCARASAPASAPRWRGCATPSGCRSPIVFTAVPRLHRSTSRSSPSRTTSACRRWAGIWGSRTTWSGTPPTSTGRCSRPRSSATPTSTHLGFHETYISYLIGIFYRLAPRPETLLALQAALIGGAVLPFFAFARRHVGDWTACLLAVLINLYAPLHGSNLYDFHYLPFAPFFLWWCLWALESRRNVMAVVAVTLTLANREDMSALLDGGRASTSSSPASGRAPGAGRDRRLGGLFRGHQAHPDAALPERLPRLHQPVRGAAPRGGDRLRRHPQDGDRKPGLHRQQPARARQGPLPAGDRRPAGLLPLAAADRPPLLDPRVLLHHAGDALPAAHLSISFQYTAYWTAFYLHRRGRQPGLAPPPRGGGRRLGAPAAARPGWWR